MEQDVVVFNLYANEFSNQLIDEINSLAFETCSVLCGDALVTREDFKQAYSNGLKSSCLAAIQRCYDDMENTFLCVDDDDIINVITSVDIIR
jgi:hypothetical protein